MIDNMYPMKLSPVLKDAVWGGERLSSAYGFENTRGRLAEAWTLSVSESGVSVVENGVFAGSSLDKCGCGHPFPLLVKLIGSELPLSVQVHPAKSELWYIVDCSEDAYIAYGMKEDYRSEDIRIAAESGCLQELLNIVKVKAGSVFYIPQGMVHALGGGITVAEIQQNSDITYRLYDYGRLYRGVLRELHTEQALSVFKHYAPDDAELMRISGSGLHGGASDTEFISPLSEDISGISVKVLADCEFFKVLSVSGSGRIKLPEVEGDFISLLCLRGSGFAGDEMMCAGNCFYIPRGCSEMNIILDSAEVLIIYPA